MAVKIYEYYNSNSVIHKINPIVKIIWLVAFSTLVLISSSIQYLGLLLVFTLLVQLMTKIPLRALKQYIIYLLFFLVITSLLIILTRESTIIGVLFLVKISILIISAIQFTLTTTKKELLVSLIKLKIPYSFAFTLTIALRFLPTIIKEVREIANAQKTRAHKIMFNILKPIESIKSYIPIIIPLFIIVFNRSFELSLSSEARGFSPDAYRHQKLNFGLVDFVAITILFAFVYFIKI